MHSLIQDLRFSLRQIRRSPGFMVTAVLTLALGVGANTAIFSLLDQALLRSLKSGRLSLDGLVTHVIRAEQLGAVYDGLLYKKDEYLGVLVDWRNG